MDRNTIHTSRERQRRFLPFDHLHRRRALIPQVVQVRSTLPLPVRSYGWLCCRVRALRMR